MIATRAGVPVARYSDAQPTSGTSGNIPSMALYAGTSVGSVRRRATAAEITREIAGGLGSR